MTAAASGTERHRDTSGGPRAAKERGAEDARPKATPLPLFQMAIICIALLTESICFTMLIPFIGYYVSFMTGRPVEEAGYSVGYLVGLFMFAQLISSKVWGVILERVGRKAGLVVGIFVSAIAVLLFGLTTNVYLCAFWRFVHGLGAGCSIGARTMIADLTDRTNQAKGFALVSLTWGVGTLIGPAAGGALYDPVERDWLAWLHLSKSGFLATHPAFLPCFLASLYNMFAAFTCAFFLTETCMNARPIHMFLPRAIGRPLRPLLRLVQPQLPGYDINAAEDEEGGSVGRAKEVVVVADVAGGEGEGKDSADVTVARGGDGDETHSRREENEVAAWGYVEAFKDPVIRCVLVMSMLISTSDMIYLEVFPLWAVAPRNLGGLGLDPPAVSVLILVCSAPAVLANLLFAKVLGSFKSEIFFWNLTQAGYAILTLGLPAACFVRNDRAAYWYAMVFSLLRKFPDCWCFGVLMLVCAQTAPPGRTSVMYGMQQATSSLVRCVVPFTCAPLFAWSINGKHSFPLDQWLLYLLLCIPLGISIAISGSVVLPAEDVGSDENERAEGSDRGGSDYDVVANESVRNASFANSLHSFAGSEPGRGPAGELLLKNSFASLAHSFANNLVGGGLQRTIMPPLTDLTSTRQDFEEEERKDTPADGDDPLHDAGDPDRAADPTTTREDREV